jgi:hypothetical protein
LSIQLCHLCHGDLHNIISVKIIESSFRILNVNQMAPPVVTGLQRAYRITLG